MSGYLPLGSATLALGIANVRYWACVAPAVRRELRHWEHRARMIEDPVLRLLAQAKLREERFNAEVAATLATLAPRCCRASAITASVAFQVIYDYLDAIGEQPVADPLRNGRHLYRAFGAALAATPGADYYRHHPQQGDGGYLDALAAACRTAFTALPAAAIVAPVARRTAARCGEAQARTHAVAREGAGQLERWATRQAIGAGLLWWEVAAGAAASVLTVHALIAAAADAGTTHADAARIEAAYLPVCALTTLLDSLVDHASDVISGGHRYLAYYADDADAATRLRALTHEALARARTLPHGSHHAMSVAGAAAYYLSALGGGPHGALVGRAVAAELGPTIWPVLLLFRVWRLMKRVRRDQARRGAAAHPEVATRQRPSHPRLASSTRAPTSTTHASAARSTPARVSRDALW